MCACLGVGQGGCGPDWVRAKLDVGQVGYWARWAWGRWDVGQVVCGACCCGACWVWGMLGVGHLGMGQVGCAERRGRLGSGPGKVWAELIDDDKHTRTDAALGS